MTLFSKSCLNTSYGYRAFWTSIEQEHGHKTICIGTIILILAANWMKRDGWLSEPDGVWVLRFRYDWESWDQNPKVIVDKGRLERNGIPLLKSRKRMRRDLAIQLWVNLLTAGWRRSKPQWE